MLKKASLFVLATLILFSFTNLFAQAPKATYVGAKKCKPCHMKDNTAKVWEKTKHAVAFKTLSGEAAKKINKTADTDKTCLGCHTVDMAFKDDGIECEACHGPGSLYAKMDVMKDAAKAKAAGLIMPKDDAKVCEKCHNKKSPTFKDFKYSTEWAKIAHPAKKG